MGLTDPMQDLFAGLWLADSVGAFLSDAGPGAAYYHSPIQPEPLRPGCQAWSTYGNFVADEKLEIKQYTAQYFAGQLLNLDWVKHGAGMHELYPAKADLEDDVKHELITAYAVKRPDGEWSLLIVNKDPTNPHEVKIAFEADGQQTGMHFAGQVKDVTWSGGVRVALQRRHQPCRSGWAAQAEPDRVEGRPERASAASFHHRVDG